MVRLTEQEDGKGHSDRRLCVYAIYFDSKKTVAQGRKLPAALACESPILKEVADCLNHLKLPWQFEDKRYSRDAVEQRGRLRVTLRNEEDVPINPELKTRKDMYVAVAHMLKVHPERLKRVAAGPAPSAAAAALGAASASPAVSSPTYGSGASGSGSAKKGKKGKK